MTTTVTIAQTLPWGGEASLVIGLAAGIVLWLFGARVLKRAFVAIGMALGAFAGAVLLPLTGSWSLDLGQVSVGAGLIGLVVGAVMGGVVSFLMFRVIITTSSGIVFALAGTMGGLVYLQYAPSPRDQTAHERVSERVDGAGAEVGDALAEARRRGEEAEGAVREYLQGLGAEEAAARAGEVGGEMLGEDVRAQLRDAAARSRAFIDEIKGEATRAWEQRTPRERVVILGSMVAGLLVGIVTGTVFPRRATALLTALLGGAVWLFSAVALLRLVAGLGPEALSLSAQTWAVIWVGTAVIGLALQLSVLRRGASAGSDDDEDDEDDED